jgi:hypothetical protein
MRGLMSQRSPVTSPKSQLFSLHSKFRPHPLMADSVVRTDSSVKITNRSVGAADLVGLEEIVWVKSRTDMFVPWAPTEEIQRKRLTSVRYSLGGPRFSITGSAILVT